MTAAWEQLPAWEARLRDGLATEVVGHPLIAYREVHSTNEVVKELALNGAPDGLALVCERQTAGRGRRGRNWISHPGQAVSLSVLLRPAWPTSEAAWLGVLGGVVAAEAAAALGLSGIAIKWPNDVLVRGRKLGGVLVEPRLGDRGIEYAVLGVGFNVAQASADWPPELAGRATSCCIEGVVVDCDRVIQMLLRQLDQWYRPAGPGGHDRLLAAWSRWTGSDRLPVLD